MSSTARAIDRTRPETTGSTVAGLVRELEQIQRQLQALRGLPGRVDELAGTLAQLADTVALTRRSAGEPVPCWLDHPLDAGNDPATSRAVHDATQLLDRLAGWVANVYLRYTDAVRSLPDCWMRHPDVVEELLWLHRAWLAVYDAGAAATAVGDWHDRQRPGVVARIRASVGTCSLDAHQPGADQNSAAPVKHTADAVGVIAHWWATARDQPAPIPTQQQLSAAMARYRTAQR